MQQLEIKLVCDKYKGFMTG